MEGNVDLRIFDGSAMSACDPFALKNSPSRPTRPACAARRRSLRAHSLFRSALAFFYGSCLWGMGDEIRWGSREVFVVIRVSCAATSSGSSAPLPLWVGGPAPASVASARRTRLSTATLGATATGSLESGIDSCVVPSARPRAAAVRRGTQDLFITIGCRQRRATIAASP